jgi:hypothetical protein
MIYSNKKFVSESASSEQLGHDPDVMKPNGTGLEGIDVEDYYGFNPDQGLARSEELSDDENAYGDFFRNPIAMKAFTEHMNLSDPKTRKAIMAMNEAEQGAALTALTSKLYDNIVSKVDDIDYGEIPMTKGDVTKLSNYMKLRECIDLLNGILKEYKQDTTPINEIALALAHIEARKDLFMRAFKLDVELPIILYNTTVLNIISAVSYMIATCIEFIKTPNQDSFQVTLDKVAYAKTKSNMIYGNLKKFNKVANKHDLDEALNHVIKTKVHHEGAAIGSAITAIGSFLGAHPIALGITITAIILTVLIPLLREMVFLFFYTKMRVSEFFEIQADLLQMNAYNVENNSSMDNDKKKKVVSKQLKIVEWLRKMSNKFAINNRKAEVEAEREIKDNNKKMDIDDISSNSVIF